MIDISPDVTLISIFAIPSPFTQVSLPFSSSKSELKSPVVFDTFAVNPNVSGTSIFISPDVALITHSVRISSKEHSVAPLIFEILTLPTFSAESEVLPEVVSIVISPTSAYLHRMTRHSSLN